MEKINLILDRFQSFRMPATAIDQYEQIGKSILSEKIGSYVKSNYPIEFVMLGLPFKSINTRDKVLGILPDLGEKIMADTFSKFNSVIKEVYEPGINITVVSDGFVFNDILKVNPHIVDAYKEACLDLGFNILDLRDFYSKRQVLTEAREKLMNQFGVTQEKLEQDILLNPDVNFLYRGMMKFMEEELAIYEFPSKSQLHKEAKKIAREMMFRNEAYSNLVRKEFSDYIRLSMHPSVNNGSKYSFQLIPGGAHSPWHSAIVKQKGNITTMHKKDAQEQGFELIYINGKPNHFSKN